ncbi:restriction endonuclease subunit S [Turicibacter sanguinis]|uniref:restriction endonuclease subunit S n=1 Tax=Turicibacter sanguinis TaxID=154288 RepID=UPI0039965AC2
MSRKNYPSYVKKIADKSSFNYDLLNKYCFFQEGPGLRKWQFKDQGIKVINVTNLVSGKLDLDNTNRYVSVEEVTEKYEHFLTEVGDIVVASSGNSWGKVAVIQEEHLPLLMNTSVIRFKSLDNGILHNDFLYQYLISDIFKSQINFLITGSAQPNFGPYHLNQTYIPLPSLKEQQKIAEILSSVDAAIEKTEQVIAKTEEVKKGLMQQLLTKGIDHTEFKQTEIGEIPVEWKICSLEEISIIKGEYGIGASATEYNPSKPRYLRITDIDDYGYLSDKDIRGFEEEEYEKYLLKMGDLVFARTGNTTGKTYMYRSGDGDLVFAGFLIRFRFDPELCNVAFINYLTQTKYYSDWINVNSQRSGQPGINSNQYCKFKVALPSIGEQIKIVSILDKVEEKITIERTNLEKYAQLKQGLMQQLLTGQVRVKID